MSKALVVGGGGSKGAYAVGIVDALQKEYEYYLGTSTGALIVCLASVGKYEELKEAYTNLNTDKIFSENPFKDNGKLRYFRVLKRFLKGKTSLGDTANLLDYIRENFTESDFEIVNKLGKEIIVTVSNLDTKTTEFRSSKDLDYLEFTKSVWQSTLAYPFTEHDNGCADGGYTCIVPIVKACSLASDIDCIILQKEDQYSRFRPKNIIKGIAGIIDVFMQDSLKEYLKDVDRMKLHKDLNVNYYYTPYKLTDNSMYFNKDQMIEWYNIGYESV